MTVESYSQPIWHFKCRFHFSLRKTQINIFFRFEILHETVTKLSGIFTHLKLRFLIYSFAYLRGSIVKCKPRQMSALRYNRQFDLLL